MVKPTTTNVVRFPNPSTTFRSGRPVPTGRATLRKCSQICFLQPACSCRHGRPSHPRRGPAAQDGDRHGAPHVQAAPPPRHCSLFLHGPGQRAPGFLQGFKPNRATSNAERRLLERLRSRPWGRPVPWPPTHTFSTVSSQSASALRCSGTPRKLHKPLGGRGAGGLS